MEIDWNHCQSVQVKARGKGGTLANQLDWDAHLKIYIPFENFVSTPKHDRRVISIFCSPVTMRCRWIFSPLFPNLSEIMQINSHSTPPPPPKRNRKHIGILFNPTNITSIASDP